jgi:uncharacterized membrane-anchored protein
MAHFARIEDGVVCEVIVINNEVLHDENGIEQESKGIILCKSLYGADTEWVQTSYNNSFRGKYAGSGDKWDGTNFVSPVIQESDDSHIITQGE